MQMKSTVTKTTSLNTREEKPTELTDFLDKQTLFCEQFTKTLVEGIQKYEQEYVDGDKKEGRRTQFGKRILVNIGQETKRFGVPLLGQLFQLAGQGVQQVGQRSHHKKIQKLLTKVDENHLKQAALSAYLRLVGIEIAHLYGVLLEQLPKKDVEVFATMAAQRANRYLYRCQAASLDRNDIIWGVLEGGRGKQETIQMNTIQFKHRHLHTDKGELTAKHIFTHMGVMKVSPIKEGLQFQCYRRSDDKGEKWVEKYGYRGSFYEYDKEKRMYLPERLEDNFLFQASPPSFQEPVYLVVLQSDIKAYLEARKRGNTHALGSFNAYCAKTHFKTRQSVVAVIHSTNLSDKSGLSLAGGDFSYSVCIGLDLSGQDLTKTSFHHAVLALTNFEDATIQATDFRGANLCFANLTNLKKVAKTGTEKYAADFHSAQLKYADMSGTDFSSCCFEQSDLTGADIAGSDFRKAHTQGWITTGCLLSEAKIDTLQKQNERIEEGMKSLKREVTQLKKSKVNQTPDEFTFTVAQEGGKGNYLGKELNMYRSECHQSSTKQTFTGASGKGSQAIIRLNRLNMGVTMSPPHLANSDSTETKPIEDEELSDSSDQETDSLSCS